MGKSNERILCKLSKREILRLYSIVHVAMETMKTPHFTCQSKSFISMFFTCQVSACELQPFSCHDLANDIYSQTAKTVFSHVNLILLNLHAASKLNWRGGRRKAWMGKERLRGFPFLLSPFPLLFSFHFLTFRCMPRKLNFTLALVTRD